MEPYVTLLPELPLICPDCAASLQTDAHGDLRCSGCSALWPMVDGVRWLGRRQDHYHADVPEAVMRAMLDAATPDTLRRRFAAMLRDLPAERAWFYSHNAFAGARAAAQLLLPLGPQSRVLDLGCGWGNLSAAAGLAAGQVVAMDLAPLRARFTQLHLQAEGLDNALVLGGGDGRYLPFAAASFDAVILNGVLEWVGEPTAVKVTPDEALAAFLAEVRRVLRPGGRVLIGIENRFSAKYILGMPEEHVNQRYVSLLPRWMADRYLRRVQGRPYRIRTYSHWGIARVLQAAGFQEVERHLPLPDYRNPDRIALHGSHAALRATLVARQWRPMRAKVMDLAARWGLLPHLVHSFVAVARKPLAEAEPAVSPSEVASGDPGSPARDELTALGEACLTALRQQGGAPAALAERLCARTAILESGVTGSMRLVLLSPDDASRAAVASVGAGPEGVVIAAKAAALGQLVALDLPAPLRSSLPQILAQFRWGRRTVLLRPWIEGRSLIEEVGGSKGEALLGEAANWLIALHSATHQQKCFDAADWASYVDRPWEELRRLLPLPSSIEAMVENRLPSLSRINGRELPRVFVHGDFEFRNLLRTPEGGLKVIDWELAEPAGLPLGDLAHLLVAYVSNRRGYSYGAAARSLFLDRGVTAKLADGWLERYCQALNVPQDLMRPLLALALLRDAAQWARRCNHDLVSDWWTPHLISLAELLDA